MRPSGAQLVAVLPSAKPASQPLWRCRCLDGFTWLITQSNAKAAAKQVATNGSDSDAFRSRRLHQRYQRFSSNAFKANQRYP